MMLTILAPVLAEGLNIGEVQGVVCDWGWLPQLRKFFLEIIAVPNICANKSILLLKLSNLRHIQVCGENKRHQGSIINDCFNFATNWQIQGFFNIFNYRTSKLITSDVVCFMNSFFSLWCSFLINLTWAIWALGVLSLLYNNLQPQLSSFVSLIFNACNVE